MIKRISKHICVFLALIGILWKTHIRFNGHKPEKAWNIRTYCKQFVSKREKREEREKNEENETQSMLYYNRGTRSSSPKAVPTPALLFCCPNVLQAPA